MKMFGGTLAEGTTIVNASIATGTSFPSSPDDGELFYRMDTSVAVRGLYCYIGTNWDRLASSDSLTVPSGLSYPSVANSGDLFYYTGTPTGLAIFDQDDLSRADISDLYSG